MQTIVEYLCSDVCLPRNPGTPGGAAARDFLIARLDALSLKAAGNDGFAQAIPPLGGTNLLARIPGRSERTVLLAAHYDACGTHNPGADDNAAAVAVVLDAAAQLTKRDLNRTVLIALFDSEEPPYFLTPEMGSQWFVDHPTVPLDTIDTMIALDLVGHALGPEGLPDEVRNSVFVLGAEKSTGTAAVMDNLSAVKGIVPRRVDNYIIPSMSDYDAFMNASIPFLFYTAGRTEHYHAPTDTPNLLDYDKMAALVNHLTELVTALANRPDTPVFLADGFDDDTTVASIRVLFNALAPFSPAAENLQSIVGDIEQRLADNGVLKTTDRQLISRLIGQVEASLA